jgi:hypothetical protein
VAWQSASPWPKDTPHRASLEPPRFVSSRARSSTARGVGPRENSLSKAQERLTWARTGTGDIRERIRESERERGGRRCHPQPRRTRSELNPYRLPPRRESLQPAFRSSPMCPHLNPRGPLRTQLQIAEKIISIWLQRPRAAARHCTTRDLRCSEVPRHGQRSRLRVAPPSTGSADRYSSGFGTWLGTTPAAPLSPRRCRPETQEDACPTISHEPAPFCW